MKGIGQELRLDGQVAVVTGAGRGIGRAEALLLAGRGAAVVVNDLGVDAGGRGAASDVAQNLVDEIVEAGGTAVPNADSVATPAGAEAIVEAALARFGRVDIVVNNAGIADFHPFPEVDAAEFQRQLSVHLIGSFNVTRAAWGAMVDRRYGRVVMTISPAVYGTPRNLAYASAKGGILALTRSLAVIGRAAGIKVNAIAPNAYTRMAESVKDDKVRIFSQLSQRPEDVAPVVILLAHESCPVSGEMFAVTAGRVARMFLAEASGFIATGHSPEDLLAHWDEVMDEGGYTVPADTSDNLRNTFERLRQAGLNPPRLQPGR